MVYISGRSTFQMFSRCKLVPSKNDRNSHLFLRCTQCTLSGWLCFGRNSQRRRTTLARELGTNPGMADRLNHLALVALCNECPLLVACIAHPIRCTFPTIALRQWTPYPEGNKVYQPTLHQHVLMIRKRDFNRTQSLDLHKNLQIAGADAV